MSKKELNKAMVVGLAIEKKITQKEAARRLGLSTRQIKRLAKIISTQGPDAIVHKSRGKPKPAKHCLKTQDKILSLLKDKYYDFGPTLATEKLQEVEGIGVSVEGLRQFMISKSLWRPKQKKPAVYHPRARRSKYGELIQIDGSHHHWFEDRGPKCVALVFVDDATSRLQLIYFCESENLHGYLNATKKYFELYGCPQEIYTDKHTVFTVSHMRGGENKGKTHYSKLLKEFNIKQHLANSPQAKGRVERMNRTLQDRLIKELRMRNINDIGTANGFMPEFIDIYNSKFAKQPKDNLNTHLLLTKEQQDNIDNIFAIKEHRSVSKALTAQYKNKIFVINQVRAARTLRKRGVVVHEMLNGDIKMFSGGLELDIEFFEYADNYNGSISRKELDIKLDSQSNTAAANIALRDNLNTQRGHFNLGQ